MVPTQVDASAPADGAHARAGSSASTSRRGDRGSTGCRDARPRPRPRPTPASRGRRRGQLTRATTICRPPARSASPAGDACVTSATGPRPSTSSSRARGRRLRCGRGQLRGRLHAARTAQTRRAPGSRQRAGPSASSGPSRRRSAARLARELTLPELPTSTTLADEPAYRVLYKDAEGDQKIFNIFALLILGGARSPRSTWPRPSSSPSAGRSASAWRWGCPARLAVRPLLVGAEIALLGSRSGC